MNGILQNIIERTQDLSEPELRDLEQIVDTFVETRSLPTIRLSDEQVAEVKRRMADPNPVYYDREEVEAHINALLA